VGDSGTECALDSDVWLFLLIPQAAVHVSRRLAVWHDEVHQRQYVVNIQHQSERHASLPLAVSRLPGAAPFPYQTHLRVVSDRPIIWLEETNDFQCVLEFSPKFTKATNVELIDMCVAG
jgi:hypothetical protein